MRMLIVSGHKLISQSLVTMMHTLSTQQSSGAPIEATACSPLEAEQYAHSARSEVILVDASGGLEQALGVTQAIERAMPQIPIVVLGSDDTEDTVLSVISAGASGYVSRDGSPESLVATIAGVARGELGIPRSAALKVVRQLTQSPRTPDLMLTAEMTAKLTKREREIFGLLREGLRSSEIAQRLSISNGTVYKHVQNILSKLQVHSRAQAVLMGEDKSAREPREPVARSSLPLRHPPVVNGATTPRSQDSVIRRSFQK